MKRETKVRTKRSVFNLCPYESTGTYKVFKVLIKGLIDGGQHGRGALRGCGASTAATVHKRAWVRFYQGEKIECSLGDLFVMY